ncbi:MAG: HAMP domain-containing sensor histidine kinase [Proteobacteria bacterium]|nr:HAMP domain-containing sensor histidine kinase [Pseudomonadota bacterium]
MKHPLFFHRLLRITTRVITHPIFIFVSFQCVWITLTLFWVVWFAPSLEDLKVIFDIGESLSEQPQNTIQEPLLHSNMAQNIYSHILKPHEALLRLTAGLVMLGTLLFGAIWLFWFGQRKASYYRQQQSFISSVTHELRTPITTLKLILSNLKNPSLSEEKYHNLLDIGDHELKRLMHLIHNILLTAGLDRGIDMLDEKKQRLTVKALLEHSMERCKALDEDIAKRVIIKCLPPMSINAPRTALITLFTNLMENAIKYSPKGSAIHIDASFYAGDYVDVTFRDQGYGIEESDRKKIFKMFYRGEISKKQAINGTGVGLFIVKTITKLLGGQVWCESKGPHKGSVFTVRLPID